MSMMIGGISGRNPFGPIIYEPIGQRLLWALTLGFATGELWGVNGQVFKPQTLGNSLNEATESITVIPMVTFEKIHLRCLRDYVQLARSELQLRPPYTVELGAAGLDGVYLATPAGGICQVTVNCKTAVELVTVSLR